MEQMQHLHGASSGSPLPLPSLSCLLLWSDAAVPAPKAAHGSTVVCRAGARRGEREDGCNPRQFRETLVSSLEDTGPPHLGARSHLLLDIETPGFPLQDCLRAPPGEAKGWDPVQAGPPPHHSPWSWGWGQLWRHSRDCHLHQLKMWKCHRPACSRLKLWFSSPRGDFWGTLCAFGDFPLDIWAPQAGTGGRQPGRIGTPGSPSYVNSRTTTTKKVSLKWKKLLIISRCI